MLTQKMQEIINKVDTTLPKDYIIRYLYVNMPQFFQRDLKYFLASEDEKYNQYKQGFINRGRNVVCSTYADFYVDLYNSFGIKAKKVIANSSKIPLFAVIAEGENGFIFMNPIGDLFYNQYNLDTVEFGVVPHYKTLKTNYPFLVSLDKDYIKQIDKNLNLNKTYNDFFSRLHLEMTNNNLISKHFLTSSSNREDLFIKKMEFANEHLINLGNVNGAFERVQLYMYLERIMFFKTEKKNLKIYLEENNGSFTPHIEYRNNLTNNTIVYEEQRKNEKFVLQKKL